MVVYIHSESTVYVSLRGSPFSSAVVNMAHKYGCIEPIYAVFCKSLSAPSHLPFYVDHLLDASAIFTIYILFHYLALRCLSFETLGILFQNKLLV